MRYALILMLVCAPALHAQSSCNSNPAPCTTANGTLLVNFTIGRALQLSIAPVATPLTTPTAAHYDAGFAATTGPTATIRSNAPWTLAISSAAATWTAVNTQSEPARINKPDTDLTWATNMAGPFTPLSTTPVTLVTGNATAGSVAASLFYRTLYDWALDTPGQYSLQIVFTITAP